MKTNVIKCQVESLLRILVQSSNSTESPGKELVELLYFSDCSVIQKSWLSGLLKINCA